MSPLWPLPIDSREHAAVLELLAAETQLRQALHEEESLLVRLEELDALLRGSPSGPQQVSLTLQQRLAKLELEAAQTQRAKTAQWETQARLRLQDARQHLSAEQVEQEHERAVARAEALVVQAKVAEVMEAGRPPPPEDPPGASLSQQVMFTPAWFVQLSRVEYQALLERYVFPDLDHINWCLVPDASEFTEAGIYGQGYRDIDESEWATKHSEWQHITENKIKYLQQADRLNQQMMDALVAVERRARARLVTECERARMFLWMQMTLLAVEVRECAALVQEEVQERHALATAFRMATFADSLTCS